MRKISFTYVITLPLLVRILYIFRSEYTLTTNFPLSV